MTDSVSCLGITRLCVCALVRTPCPLGHRGPEDYPRTFAHGGEKPLSPGLRHAPTIRSYLTCEDAADEQSVLIPELWSELYPGCVPAHAALFTAHIDTRAIIGAKLWSSLVCPVCEIDSPLFVPLFMCALQCAYHHPLCECQQAVRLCLVCASVYTVRSQQSCGEWSV